jgi:hypothetical protein
MCTQCFAWMASGWPKDWHIHCSSTVLFVLITVIYFTWFHFHVSSTLFFAIQVCTTFQAIVQLSDWHWPRWDSLQMFMKERFQATFLRCCAYPLTEIDIFICWFQPIHPSINWLHITISCPSNDLQHLIVRSIMFTIVVKLKSANFCHPDANRYSPLSSITLHMACTIIH